MKKKIVSALLCVAMTFTALAGCGSKEEAAPVVNEEQTQETETTTEVKEEAAPEATAEAIPTPAYYFSFDKADDSDAIAPTAQDKTATPILSTIEKDKVYIPGVKGDSLYVDGVTGYKLTDVKGVGDNYTVSFWLYATRFANYMPTVQFGPDIHGDVTGGQHYLNITRTEWNSAGPSFPCIWAYDQNDNGLWPAWAPAEADEHLKQWMNITISVDSSNISEDGTMLIADLYVNGEKLESKDSDGNVIPINVVKGCMQDAEGFEFLVGVNYWDSVFKGAVDELYIFDQAITEGQALALYKEGDPTVAYQEPERVVEVKQTEGALDQIGNVDLTAGFWTDWSKAYEIKDGETKNVTLKNYSDGVNLWDNYVLVFTNEASEAHQDPNTVSDKHVEYGAVRADAYGWGYVDATFENSWGNWDTWRTKVMVEADVNLTISRNGEMITIVADNVDINGTSNVMKANVTTTLTKDDPCFFLFTNEASYVEVLKVEDAIVVEADPNAVASIGKTDFSNAWWTDWSEAVEIKNGETKTVELKNYSDGVNNWDNYVVMFTNEASAAGQDPNTVSDSHVEYAALRADAYGWGDCTFEYETSWADDWATWLNAMKDADVTLTITRNDNVFVVDAVIVDRNGEKLTNKSTVTSNLLTADAPAYFLLTCEECYIDIMSIK